MGSKPSVTYKFSYPAISATDNFHKFQALFSKQQLPASYELTETREDTYEFFVAYHTPTCGYIDLIYVKVVSTGETSCEVWISSNSTNFCPGWCGCCRTIFNAVNFFEDFGNNEEHIDELIKILGGQYDIEYVASAGNARIKNLAVVQDAEPTESEVTNLIKPSGTENV